MGRPSSVTRCLGEVATKPETVINSDMFLLLSFDGGNQEIRLSITGHKIQRENKYVDNLLQVRSEDLCGFFHFGLDNKIAIGLVWILGKKVLMIFLAWPKLG